MKLRCLTWACIYNLDQWQKKRQLSVWLVNFDKFSWDESYLQKKLRTTLGHAVIIPFVKTMPAKLESFAFILAANKANHSYQLFIASLHHRVAFWTFLNSHALDQIVPGDFVFKLFNFFLWQNSQATNVYVVPLFAAINRWFVLAHVGTQKLGPAYI